MIALFPMSEIVGPLGIPSCTQYMVDDNITCDGLSKIGNCWHTIMDIDDFDEDAT